MGTHSPSSGSPNALANSTESASDTPITPSHRSFLMLGSTPLRTWFLSFFLFKANLDQLEGVTSLESEVLVIRVHDLYSGASEKPLTWAVDRFTSAEKQCVTRNWSGAAAAIPKINADSTNIALGKSLLLNRAHSLLWKPTMSEEEEVSGGEEGAGELQDDDVWYLRTTN